MKAVTSHRLKWATLPPNELGRIGQQESRRKIRKRRDGNLCIIVKYVVISLTIEQPPTVVSRWSHICMLEFTGCATLLEKYPAFLQKPSGFQ